MSSPIRPNRYMENEPVAVMAPPGFPSHQADIHGAHPGWYNRYIRAWEHWASHVIPHEKPLWIETVNLLRPPKKTTKRLHSHGLGKGIKDDNIDQTMSWAKIAAVMLNAEFFPDVMDSV